MEFGQELVRSSEAMRHLLESRLHMLAAVEAMADMEGCLDEYHRAVDLRDGLDDLLMALEDKTRALSRRTNGAEGVEYNGRVTFQNRRRPQAKRPTRMATIAAPGRVSTPKGIRTPVAAVRGRCPGPLDDGGEDRSRIGTSIRNWRPTDKGGAEFVARRSGLRDACGLACPQVDCSTAAVATSPCDRSLRRDPLGQRHERRFQVDLVFLEAA